MRAGERSMVGGWIGVGHTIAGIVYLIEILEGFSGDQKVNPQTLIGAIISLTESGLRGEYLLVDEYTDGERHLHEEEK